MSLPIFRSPYPGYDVRDKRDTPSWDETTRRVIDARLAHVPTQRFFGEHAYRTLEAVCARLMPQPERGADPVPIAPFLDAKLHEGRSDGYWYADLPPRPEAWRRALEGIDQHAQRHFGGAFVALSGDAQDAVLRAIQRGEADAEAFAGWSSQRFFDAALMSDVLTVYYAHPAAMSEIGFGGPASPRGYARLDADQHDPWEAEEAP